MFDAIATPASFIALLSLLGIGAIGSLVIGHNDKLANGWTHSWAIVAALWGMLLAIAIFVTGNTITGHIAVSGFSFFSLSIRLDKLTAFFVFIISLITLFSSMYGIGYIREYYQRYHIGALGFLYNLFLLGMLLVVTAANGIFFLLAWEIMSLASYFLVVYDYRQQQNVRAGYKYLIMTHAASACLVIAFSMLYHFTGSFDFSAIAANAHLVPELAKGIVFGLFCIGLGTKAGIVPLHVWLPSAHPAAPSHISALMSGVMIKTGIYMMIRLLLEVLQPIPLWWGEVVLAIGAVSAVCGVLYALTEHDIKRLLAYHSIENIGIILLGLGSAMIFSSLGQPLLSLLALTAALFHTLNHAVFKSLLFMGAGAVIQATHTRNIEAYGGLIKLLPFTSLFFLVGSMAISALPPFNGFFSEWLTFQSLFNGLHAGGHVKWLFLAAAASLALTGGLAAACFVKAYGATFLARPRSSNAAKAKEAPVSMRAGMGGLAIICLLVGLAAGPVSVGIQNIGQQIMPSVAAPAVASSAQGTLSTQAYQSSVSGPAIIVALGVVGFITWAVVRFGMHRRQKVVQADAWDCGTPLTGRMEITATGLARSITLFFRGIARPTLQRNVQGGPNPYIAGTRTVTIGMKDIYYAYFYRPVYASLQSVTSVFKRIQNGNISAYVLYMLAALLITLTIARYV